jgi:FtsP/CotA-like multicopper oxidase with cupredoxin domain
MSESINRRNLVKLGLASLGALTLGQWRVPVPFLDGPSEALAKSGSSSSGGSASTTTSGSRLFGYKPFSQPLFIPSVALARPRGTLSPKPGQYERDGQLNGRPRAPRGNFNDVAHGIAPEYDGRVPGFPCQDWNRFSNHAHEKEYRIIIEETVQPFFPGISTPIFAFRDAYGSGPGRTPGPTFLTRFREPVVVRYENHLTKNRGPINTTGHDIESSVHLHGSHVPSHADGAPDFYTLAGEAKDYYYPNIAPRVTQADRRAKTCEGSFDQTWIPSTIWYHDHAMDITGFNVSRGLAGFYLMFDEREEQLIESNVLPDPDQAVDIGLALTDQKFNADGTLAFNFFEHDGRLGDVFTVNGTVQPFLEVQRRKYRFRILNASNARMYQLRLSSGQPFLVFGADSWLFPKAGLVKTFELAPGQRHDVIVDFRNAPNELFLDNIMLQSDGRKGDKVDPSKPTPLMKFVVKGPAVANDVTITDGTVIRDQWARMSPNEVVATRSFRTDRSIGSWTINNRFFNPRRADAVPELGTAEHWSLENNSGGWWHPFHTHLEGFQIQTLNGAAPPFERSFNSDLVNLHGGEVAKVLLKFRTFTGPFVAHCHNIEHEDMRMMIAYDPRPSGVPSPLDGERRIDPNVSGVVPDCRELEEEHRIYFDVAGDLDRVEDRGVGFPNCDFDMNKRGNQL